MNNNSINHLKRRLFISAVKRIETKYCRTKYIYDVNCVNNLIFNDSSRVVALFKDFLIISDNTEFLRRFYCKDEATPRLRKIVNFYETYSKIFPNYMVLPESRYLYKNIRRKQKMIDAVNEIKREEEENRKKIAENNNNNNNNGCNGVKNVYASKKGMHSSNKGGVMCSNNNVFTEKVQQSINKYHPSFSVSMIECNENESGDVSNYMQYVNFNNNNTGVKAKYKSNNKNKKDNDGNEMSISLHASKYKKVPFNNNNNSNSNDINFNANNETNISIVDMLQLLSPSKTAKDAQHTKRISSNGVTINNNNNNTKRKKTPHRLKQPQSKKPTKTHLQLHKSKKNIYLNNIDHNSNAIHKHQQHQQHQQHHPTITTNKSKSQRLTTSSASSSINKVTHNVYNNYQNIIIKNQSTGNTVININNNYYQYQTVSNDTTKHKQQQTSSSSKNKSKQSSTAITSVKTPRNNTKHTTVVKTKQPSHTTTTPSTTSTCLTIANKHCSKSPLRKSTTTTRHKSTAHTKSNNVSSTVHNATISSAAKQRTRPIISVNPSTSTTKSARKPLKHTKSLYTHFTTVSNVHKPANNNNNNSNTLIRSESVYTVKSKYLSTTQSVFSPRHKGVNAVNDDKALTTALRCKYKAFLQKMKSSTGRYVGKRNSEGLFGNNSITTGSASSSYRGSCTNRNYLTTLISNSSVTNINLKKSVTKQIFRDISSTHVGVGVGKQHVNGVKGGLSPNMSGNAGRNSNIGVNGVNGGVNNSNSTNNVNNNWRGSSFEMMQVPNLKMKKITVNRKGYTKRGN